MKVIFKHRGQDKYSPLRAGGGLLASAFWLL